MATNPSRNISARSHRSKFLWHKRDRMMGRGDFAKKQSEKLYQARPFNALLHSFMTKTPSRQSEAKFSLQLFASSILLATFLQSCCLHNAELRGHRHIPSSALANPFEQRTPFALKTVQWRQRSCEVRCRHMKTISFIDHISYFSRTDTHTHTHTYIYLWTTHSHGHKISI